MLLLFLLSCVSSFTTEEWNLEITWPLSGAHIDQSHLKIFYKATSKSGVSLVAFEDAGCTLYLDGVAVMVDQPPNGEFAQLDGLPLGAHSLQLQIHSDIDSRIYASEIVTVYIDEIADELSRDMSDTRVLVKRFRPLDPIEDIGAYIVHPPQNGFIWNASSDNIIVVKTIGCDPGKTCSVGLYAGGELVGNSGDMQRITFVIPPIRKENTYDFSVVLIDLKTNEEIGKDDSVEVRVLNQMTGTSVGARTAARGNEMGKMLENPSGVTIVCNWRCTVGWEWGWLIFLFSKKVRYQVIEDPTLMTVAPNLILCISENIEGHNDPADFLLKIRTLRENGARRIGVFHLSDEWGGGSTTFYSSVDFVVRNYWRREVSLRENILTLPLGFATGFPLSQFSNGEKRRKYLWNFMGDVREKPWREHMLQALKEDRELREIGEGYVLVSGVVGGGLNKTSYRRVLEESSFTLCPRGFNHVESFRIYEALEAGSIPIVENSTYFSDFWGKTHPIPTCETNWREISKVIKGINVEETRARTQKWWEYTKQMFKNKLLLRMNEY